MCKKLFKLQIMSSLIKSYDILSIEVTKTAYNVLLGGIILDMLTANI